MTEVEMRGGDLCSLEVRVRICRTYRRRGLNCGIVRRHGGPVVPRLYHGGRRQRLYGCAFIPVRVREHGAVLHTSTTARERLAVYI